MGKKSYFTLIYVTELKFRVHFRILKLKNIRFHAVVRLMMQINRLKENASKYKRKVSFCGIIFSESPSNSCRYKLISSN